MSPDALLFVVFVGTAAVAAVAPLLARAMGAAAGYPLAAALAAGTAALGWLAPGVLAGRPVEVTVAWVPSAGVEFALRLDALALLFALVVLGVGALVLGYCPRYLAASTGGHARFYGAFAGFAAAMAGLVLADDVVLLYVCWELTSVTSFLLIAHEGHPEHRRAALRALFVTVAGGVALLVALLVAAADAGTSAVAGIIDAAGTAPVAGVVLTLLLAAAFTKSAQVPTHVWLPGAMVAPTPVSAYLHAAAMVQAGIYLLARFLPLFAGAPAWRDVMLAVGLVTALFGAGAALRAVDLKVILAYSTISQLGLTVALLGVGSPEAVVAALLNVVAHALYKSALFLVAGTVEHETGTRRLDRLGGLYRAMPVTTAAAALAVGSMGGLPPFVGFVAKEEALGALAALPSTRGWAAVTAGVAAAAATLAYGLRLFVDGFLGGAGEGEEAGVGWLAAPVVAALAGLGLGVVVTRLSTFVSSAAAAATTVPSEVHLALWKGPTTKFWLSVAAVVAGVVVFLLRRPAERLPWPAALSRGDAAVDAAERGVRRAGARTGGGLAFPSAGAQLAVVIAVPVAAGVAAAVIRRADIATAAPVAGPLGQRLVVALLVVACVGVARGRDRLAAVAILGVVGFLVSALYVLFGAPDLVMTQLLADTLLVALVVYVFRHVPRAFPPASVRRRAGAGAVAAFVGVSAGTAAFLLARHPELSPAAAFYLEVSPDRSGDNVVNSILTDFRALDTLGEITVVAVAAVGVTAVVRAVRR